MFGRETFIVRAADGAMAPRVRGATHVWHAVYQRVKRALRLPLTPRKGTRQAGILPA